MTNRGHRAVVMGGGIAGMLSARVLADHFEEVFLLERGTYPEDIANRKHVPQGHQVHVLLARGGELLSQWFPSMTSVLDGLGIPQRDFGADVIQYVGNTRMPRVNVGIPMRCADRPTLEWVLRSQIRDIPNITILEQHKLERLSVEAGVVTGVEASRPDGSSVELSADLVVDTMGRGSLLPSILEQHGFGTVTQDVVDAGFRYASAYVRFHDTKAMEGAAVLGAAARFPTHPVSCVAMSMPKDRYLLSTVTLHSERIVRTYEDMVAAVRDTPCKPLHAALESAELVSKVRTYQHTANRRCRYEALPRWPARLIALGDATCVFNPRFGQGMTVSAILVSLLRRHLAASPLRVMNADPQRWTRRIMRKISSALDVPWMIATNDDAVWIPGGGERWIDRATAWYAKAMIAHGARDSRVYFQQMRVAQMLAHPISLLRPKLAIPVIWHGMRTPVDSRARGGGQA